MQIAGGLLGALVVGLGTDTPHKAQALGFAADKVLVPEAAVGLEALPADLPPVRGALELVELIGLVGGEGATVSWRKKESTRWCLKWAGRMVAWNLPTLWITKLSPSSAQERNWRLRSSDRSL